MTMIPVKDIGRVIWDDLCESVAQEYPEKSEAEREEVVSRILDAWADSMFAGPVE